MKEKMPIIRVFKLEEKEIDQFHRKALRFLQNNSKEHILWDSLESKHLLRLSSCCQFDQISNSVSEVLNTHRLILIQHYDPSSDFTADSER